MAASKSSGSSGVLAAGLVAAYFALVGCGEKFSTSCEESRTCGSGASGGGSGGSGGSGGHEAAGQGGAEHDNQAGAGGAAALCDAGLTSCAEECVDTRSSPEHCGECGVVCRGASVCRKGECVACPAAQIRCAGECVDPATNAEFCGARRACSAPNQGVQCGDDQACREGVCVSGLASLEALSLEPATLTPSFDPDTLEYTASFAYFEPRLTLEAKPTDADATLEHAGQTFSAEDGVEIVATPEADVSSLEVEVTAASGAQQSYTITLERAALSTTYVKAFNSRPGIEFGSSLAVSGNTAVFGAPREYSLATGVDGNEISEGAAQAGAAYVAFRGSDGKWARQAYLKADAIEEFARFGESVAIDGDTIAVGAPGADNLRGAVFIFTRKGSTWSRQAKLTEPIRGDDQLFGQRVALQGDRLIVSATRNRDIFELSGYAYAFTRRGTSWTPDAKHPVPDDDRFLGYDFYGSSLSLSGERVAIAEEQGYASIFVLLHSASGWSVESELNLPEGGLGRAKLALDNDTLAAATPKGDVHVYERTGSTWMRKVTLTPFDAAATEGFAESVALKDGLLVVGSGCPICKGGISTFVRKGSTWVNGSFLTVSNLDPSDGLGFAVALDGSRVLASSPFEDSSANSFNQSSSNNGALDSGAAFIFE